MNFIDTLPYGLAVNDRVIFIGEEIEPDVFMETRAPAKASDRREVRRSVGRIERDFNDGKIKTCNGHAVNVGGITGAPPSFCRDRKVRVARWIAVGLAGQAYNDSA